MGLVEKIKFAVNPGCSGSLFFKCSKVNLIWSEDLQVYAEKLIEDGIQPMFNELGFEKKDFDLLNQRLKNAKNAIGMDAEEFAKRCAKGQILTGGDANSKEKYIETAKFHSTGYAMPMDLIGRDFDKLKALINADLCPVMNLDAVKSVNSHGLVYLIHEMIHVLASPEYITKLRRGKERDSDEGFTEFFARLAALYCLDTKDEYKELMGYPILYQTFFKNGCMVDGYCLKNINPDQSKELIKELAKKYFLNQPPV